MIESLTPEVFDVLVVINLVAGLFLAGRRFLKEIRGPLPEDAPDWARATYVAAQADPSPEDS